MFSKLQVSVFIIPSIILSFETDIGFDFGAVGLVGRSVSVGLVGRSVLVGVGVRIGSVGRTVGFGRRGSEAR